VLVFTRKSGEAVIIGDGIEIRVVRVGKDGVRLGITAPHDVPVHRREIYNLIMDANRGAASADPTGALKAARALRGRPQGAGGD
jgi:carbon storage regulator